MIPNRASIKREVTGNIFDATAYTYNNYLLTESDLIAADFWDDPGFTFAARDIMWCLVSGNSYSVLRMISPTTAEVATD